MSKHEIEIEGLPDGWEPVAYRCPWAGEYYIRNSEATQTLRDVDDECLIIKKKPLRRIVLEETDEIIISLRFNNYNYLYVDKDGFNKFRVMREVKETEEPGLLLSVEECKSIIECDFVDVVHKVKKFLININKTY